MVRLVVKRGDEAQFLFDTSVTTPTETLLPQLLAIYNSRLKLHRIAGEMTELAAHGTTLPPNMIGLSDEQIEELKLVDEWSEICIPSGGFLPEKDPLGRRNGQKPKVKLGDVLLKTADEAKEAVSKKLVDLGTPLTLGVVKEQIKLLEAAVRIVYPMNIPPHDPIRMELENREELTGTQDSLEVMLRGEAVFWFCGKEITPAPGKLLGDFIGKNDKSKVVVKLGKKGNGPPGREPVFTEDEKKQLMLHAYRKQQEAKKLMEDAEEEDESLNSEWADGSGLKRSCQGIRNVSWRMK